MTTSTGASLFEDNPQLANEADGWDPRLVPAKSNKKYLWKCQIGHTWEASPNNRNKLRGTGCPYCAGQKVLSGYNDLASQSPQLAAEADGWDPSQVFVRSTARKYWTCPLGHPYLASVRSRVVAETGCTICAGKQVLKGFNDLASQYPEIASEADGWDPSGVHKGTQTKFRWLCPVGHSYEMQVTGRVRGRGCNICSNTITLTGYNDLATTHPAIATEANGWDPSKVSTRNGTRRSWSCPEGHVYVMRVADRTDTRSAQGCPYCGRKKVLVGFNDLASTHPLLAREARGWDPQSVTAGHNAKKLWQCATGHEYLASVNQRTQVSSGCPYCSNQKVLSGFNDLATHRPDLASEAHGWDPSTVTRNSGVKKRWMCEVGHQWSATVDHRSQGQGCPSCARTGYDPNKKGFLYLLRHDQLGLLQIGKTNNPKERLRRHTRNGWEAIDLTQPLDGHLVSKLEQDIMKMLKGQGANFSEAEQIMGPQMTGRTEAWVMESAPIFSLRDLRASLYQEESGE